MLMYVILTFLQDLHFIKGERSFLRMRIVICLHQSLGLHPDHIERPYPRKLLFHFLLHRKQTALAQATIQQGKDMHQWIIAVYAFLDTLVVKEVKCVMKTL